MSLIGRIKTAFADTEDLRRRNIELTQQCLKLKEELRTTKLDFRRYVSVELYRKQNKRLLDTREDLEAALSANRALAFDIAENKRRFVEKTRDMLKIKRDGLRLAYKWLFEHGAPNDLLLDVEGAFHGCPVNGRDKNEFQNTEIVKTPLIIDFEQVLSTLSLAA